MKISICINLDTRPQNDSFGGSNLLGCVNEDFLGEGVKNKINFFDGFEKEIIVFVDEHTELDSGYFRWLNRNCDTVVIRKHTDENHFNDWNYIRALQLATGDIICHFDQDVSAFRASIEAVDGLISLLDKYTYISYPSYWSPDAVHDPTFNYKWVSTRFFMCKREALNFPEIIKCLNDYDYFVQKYKPSRVCFWLEHFLGLISNSDVYYPPLSPEYLIFSWDRYERGVLGQLNQMSYEQVVGYVNSCGGMHYPNDVTAKPI
jgi:hypothetical protein